jgi:peptidoglycan/LPS O-acetylase OafA/YrhL
MPIKQAREAVRSKGSVPHGSIPYLDGLRAYSILNVVLDHSIEYGGAARLIPWVASRSALPFRLVFANGGLGVRVFFVLSGFLITRLLLEEFDATGTISIRGFYGRRIARIFPAAYFYILTLIALAAFGSLQVGWQPIAVAATYMWNYTAFGASSAGAVLGHFWTLSLEEQFYLVWPGFLLLAGLRRARRIATVCVIIFPILRIGSYYFCPGSRSEIEMMFHTGADQILWGALGAFAVRGGALERMRAAKFRWAIPWLCGVVVFVLIPFAESRVRGTFIVTNISLLGFSIMLFILWLLSGEGGVARWMLASWPAVQLGLISYSVYIWQQLFLVWPGAAALRFPLNLAAALVAGWLSYKLLEVPMRSRIRGWFHQPASAH